MLFSQKRKKKDNNSGWGNIENIPFSETLGRKQATEESAKIKKKNRNK